MLSLCIGVYGHFSIYIQDTELVLACSNMPYKTLMKAFLVNYQAYSFRSSGSEVPQMLTFENRSAHRANACGVLHGGGDDRLTRQPRQPALRGRS